MTPPSSDCNASPKRTSGVLWPRFDGSALLDQWWVAGTNGLKAVSISEIVAFSSSTTRANNLPQCGFRGRITRGPQERTRVRGLRSEKHTTSRIHSASRLLSLSPVSATFPCQICALGPAGLGSLLKAQPTTSVESFGSYACNSSARSSLTTSINLFRRERRFK
jgi:hypothetical protein